MFKKSFAAVLLAVLATVLLVACGGGDGNGDSEEELGKKREDAMLEYAECMRGEGVDFPDPEFDDGRMTMGPGPGSSVDEDAMKRADEACRDILPEGGMMRTGPAGGE